MRLARNPLGANAYAIFHSPLGHWRTDAHAVETYNSAHWAQYAVAATEWGNGWLAIDEPAGLTAGDWSIDFYNGSAGVALASDEMIDSQVDSWTGAGWDLVGATLAAARLDDARDAIDSAAASALSADQKLPANTSSLLSIAAAGGGDGFGDVDRAKLNAIAAQAALITTAGVTIVSAVQSGGKQLRLKRGESYTPPIATAIRFDRPATADWSNVPIADSVRLRVKNLGGQLLELDHVCELATAETVEARLSSSETLALTTSPHGDAYYELVAFFGDGDAIERKTLYEGSAVITDNADGAEG